MVEPAVNATPPTEKLTPAPESGPLELAMCTLPAMALLIEVSPAPHDPAPAVLNAPTLEEKDAKATTTTFSIRTVMVQYFYT